MMAPAELASRRQWLVWKFIQKPGDKKPSKVPFYATTGTPRGWPNGKPRDGKPTEQQPQVDQGDPLDRQHLVTFDEALQAASGKFDGVGIAFLPGDGLIGIDLDGMVNPETGEISEKAIRVIDVSGTYTELSPSGTGFHIIGYGHTQTNKSNDIGVEMFCGRQFFTWTGNAFNDNQVTDIPEKAIAGLHAWINRAKDAARQARQPSAPAPTTTHQPAAVQTDARANKYVMGALNKACQVIANTTEGGRNNLLNEEAFQIAGYVGAGLISEALAYQALFDAARQCGLADVEITPTLQSAFRAGKQHPKQVPEPDPARAPRQQRQQPVSSAPANDNHMVTEYGYEVSLTGLPHTKDKEGAKPMATIENVREICNRLGVTVRYNVISKEEEILIPGEAFSIDNQANAALAWLESWCARFKMPTDKLASFVTYLADKQLYNPVTEWIQSKPWDGVSRIQSLLDTVTPKEAKLLPNGKKLHEVMIYRWLISAAAAAFNPNGVSAHGILVLQGEQYLGKTMWFKKLVPSHLGVLQDGLMLRPDDKDSVLQVCSHWLVELGELDATFRKSDIAALKSFITRSVDKIRRPYARKESEYVRRTVFFASVNPKEFLNDPTGNRRFWTVECQHLDIGHTIDMQQLWAEVAHLYHQGENYYLQPDEIMKLNEHNEEFQVIDPIDERITTRLDWDKPQAMWRWKTATDTLMEIGVDRPTKGDVTRAGTKIRQMNGNQAQKKRHGNVLLVPPIVMVHYAADRN